MRHDTLKWSSHHKTDSRNSETANKLGGFPSLLWAPMFGPSHLLGGALKNHTFGDLFDNKGLGLQEDLANLGDEMV